MRSTRRQPRTMRWTCSAVPARPILPLGNSTLRYWSPSRWTESGERRAICVFVTIPRQLSSWCSYGPLEKPSRDASNAWRLRLKDLSSEIVAARRVARATTTVSESRRQAPPLDLHAPRNRVAQQGRERVTLPRAPERERRRVRRIDRAPGPDRRIVAVAEREVCDAAGADRTRVAEDARLAVRLQRRVRRVQGADGRRRRARAVVRGQE